ncbi:MAG: hypothetical protein HY673_01400 [Chloroflexi bacterium]|nr:hypothetical protein [Chloroflexota bacterium]
MADGIAFETACKPTVVCVGSEFVEEANARKEALGLPDLQLVVVPAPLGPAAEARDKAVAALPDIVAALTDGSNRRAGIEAGATANRPPGGVPEEVTVGESLESPTDAVEFYYEKGWTDGLPVVPPTEARVRTMLGSVDRDAKEVLGKMPPREGIATVEKIAINAVMAGCLPEFFPVVLAATEAMLEKQYNLNWVQLATGGMCPLLVVSGPIAKQIGVNSGTNVFGSGFRANATIGRAIRLILWNIGGAIPDVGRMAVLGHPGEWSHCIAERDDTPWEPLHVERGFAPDDSCVTVVTNMDFERTSSTLSRIADKMAAFSGLVSVGNKFYLVILSPQIAWILSRQGWTKDDVRQYLWDSARVLMSKITGKGGSVRGVGSQGDETFSSFRDSIEGRFPRWIDITNPETRVPVASSPRDIMILVAGGTANAMSAVLGARKDSVPVTKRIDWKPQARATPPRSLEATTRDLRDRLEEFAGTGPYRLNPRVEMVSSVIEGLAHNELKYGSAYCTCRLPTGVLREDRRIICPCEDLARQIAEFGHCDCGLFVGSKTK